MQGDARHVPHYRPTTCSQALEEKTGVAHCLGRGDVVLISNLLTIEDDGHAAAGPASVQRTGNRTPITSYTPQRDDAAIPRAASRLARHVLRDGKKYADRELGQVTRIGQRTPAEVQGGLTFDCGTLTSRVYPPVVRDRRDR